MSLEQLAFESGLGPKQASSMKLLVTHGRITHEVTVDPTTTLQALMVQLEALTGALARTQKLICKGRVLGAGALTVEGAKLKDGAKLMLLSSASGTQTQVGVCALFKQFTLHCLRRDCGLSRCFYIEV